MDSENDISGNGSGNMIRYHILPYIFIFCPLV